MNCNDVVKREKLELNAWKNIIFAKNMKNWYELCLKKDENPIQLCNWNRIIEFQPEKEKNGFRILNELYDF